MSEPDRDFALAARVARRFGVSRPIAALMIANARYEESRMSMPPIADMMRCARREIALREQVYPRQVELGKLKRATADFELDAMRGILRLLEIVAASDEIVALIDKVAAE